MTPLVVVLIALVFAGIGVAVAASMSRALAIAAQQRETQVSFGGATFRVLYYAGTDPFVLRARMLEALTALSAVWGAATMHESIDGVFVNVLAVDSWVEPTINTRVAGVAAPSLRTVTVDRHYRALAHELAHLLEAGPGAVDPNVGHIGWTERGIQAAIDAYESALTK